MIGLRYRRRIWLHFASLVLGFCTAALLLQLSAPVRVEAGDYGAGIGAMIAVWLRTIVLWVIGVSLVTGGIVKALLALCERWRAKSSR